MPFSQALASESVSLESGACSNCAACVVSIPFCMRPFEPKDLPRSTSAPPIISLVCGAYDFRPRKKSLEVSVGAVSVVSGKARGWKNL